MKSKNSFSITIRWFLLSAFLTVTCVFAGIYITHQLAEQERKAGRGGPQEFITRVIRNLVDSGKMSAPEAFKMVAKSDRGMKRPPHSMYLLDSNGKIIDEQEGFLPNEHEVNLANSSQINESFYFYFGRRSDGPKGSEGDKPMPPPMGGRNGDERRPPHRHGPPGPPPEAIFVGAIAIAVSIIVGIGMTFLFLSLYFRKKTKQAEDVINKLKLGDLKARFEADSTKETGILMVKFNEMADQIEGLVNELRKTEQTRTKMLQELAHDLRTPVASMKNLQEMLLEKDHLMEPEKRKHVQAMAVKEVYYFERLVEDLLFLSGVNDPKYDVNFKELNLSSLIEADAEIFETDRIKIIFSQQGETKVIGNEHLIHRLVKNAISNAMRFAKSQIDVSVNGVGETVTVKITDDGPGMREEDMVEFGEKKFSRQFQEGKQDDISIGLGSVIMKRIMTLHEGSMKIQNGPQGGCEITFEFRAV